MEVEGDERREAVGLAQGLALFLEGWDAVSPLALAVGQGDACTEMLPVVNCWGQISAPTSVITSSWEGLGIRGQPGLREELSK